MKPATGRSTSAEDACWRDAMRAAACLALDPAGLGGVRIRASAGPVRDAWLAAWRSWLDDAVPVRTVPLSIDDGRLIGGLDLAASLAQGRPVRATGVLAEAAGGFVVLPMAERIEPSTAARIAAAVDVGDASRSIAVVALDEGDGDEQLGAALRERLALDVDLSSLSWRVAQSRPDEFDRDAIEAARLLLPCVTIDDESIAALCAAALALGIGSLRAPTFAMRVARALAALDGRGAVGVDDATTAARLVLAARARRRPAAEATPSEAREPEEPANEDRADEASPPHADPADDAPEDEIENDESEDAAVPDDIADVVLEAALAAMPAGTLSLLAGGAARNRSQTARGSGAGALGRSRLRGAPSGVRRGRPRPPERLSLVETLRAAAPWQRIRRDEAGSRSGTSSASPRVHVRLEDLQVVRFRQRRPTTTIFVVDASGSAALHRLAEAKGAVELMLAECYVRRDEVAVIAFRGREVELLLPPTRSLVRARRGLAGLPGGGGTPLASALDATRELAISLRRRGDTVLVVLLTDGRANVARDGTGGRPRAEADALVSARALRTLAVDAVLIDTSREPHATAAALATEMGALYRPLPHGDAAAMSTITQQAARAASAGRRAA